VAGYRSTSMSVSLLSLGIVAWAGDLNARVKGITNCTKAQVPVLLLERVSSKGCPQYHPKIGSAHQETGL
jgi:hypothetical protein